MDLGTGYQKIIHFNFGGRFVIVSVLFDELDRRATVTGNCPDIVQ